MLYAFYAYRYCVWVYLSIPISKYIVQFFCIIALLIFWTCLKPLLHWGKINDAANILFFIAVILLKTKAGKTISTSFLSLIPDLLLLLPLQKNYNILTASFWLTWFEWNELSRQWKHWKIFSATFYLVKMTSLVSTSSFQKSLN